MTLEKIPVKCEHTELADPNDLTPHPGNPNKHPKNQVRMLAKSIQSYGWRHPIVISKQSGYIVAGHARRLAALEIGCYVPIDIQSFGNETDELAVLLADNILPELSEMDHALFMAQREILLEANISLETIGIPEVEIPDFRSTDEDEQPRLDNKNMTTCPECGYEFES